MEQYMVLRPENGSQDHVVFGQVHSNSKAVEADMEHLVSRPNILATLYTVIV